MAPSTPSEVVPKLQAPGAGLPWFEGWVLRHVALPLGTRAMDWQAASKLFQEEGAKVLALWEAFPPDQLTRPVLVRRLMGMEDSSRFWSVAMAVEHLNIVGASILQLIAGLRQGKPPAREARIQDVKPHGETPAAEVRAEFIRLLSGAASNEGPPIPRGQGIRAPHPWFGPMDAHGWHCLVGIHQGIHRKQIEEIRKKLSAGA